MEKKNRLIEKNVWKTKISLYFQELDSIYAKYFILAIRLSVLGFLWLEFHIFNEQPFLKLDLIISEFLFLIYIMLLFVLSNHSPSFKTQFLKLTFDFLFITFFLRESLSLYGSQTWIYILYLIPVIFCSFWFNWSFTIIFVTIVSITYATLNYLIDNKFDNFLQSIRILAPVIMIFYLVALGIIFYKRKIKKNYEIIDKKVEEQTAELNREKEYTRNLLKSSFDAIIAVDKDGNITEVNDRACELFEYTKEEMVNRKVKDFYASGEVTKIMNILRNRETGCIENYDTYILNKKGEQIPILLSASFLYDKNLNLKKELLKRKLPTIGYFRDKRAEEAVDSIARDIISITDEKTLMDKIVKIIAQTLKAEACSLLTYNENRCMLKVNASYGMPEIIKKNEWLEWYGEKETLIAKIFFLKRKLNISNIDVLNKKPNDQYFNWTYVQKFAKYSRFKEFKHFLGTPLFINREVYGVIRVLNKCASETNLCKQGFTVSDEKLLERISTQVSMLIEKVRDKERFEAISKVGRELNERLDLSLDKLLEIITKGVVEKMQFKACFLRLIEDGNKLKIKTCYGLKGDYKDIPKYIITIGHGICGEVAKYGVYGAIHDMEKDPDEFKELIESEGLRSMLSIPMTYQGRVIGVISCYTGRMHQFTEQEIQIMNTFATYASTAIQNKKRIDELMALNEIARELAKPIKIEELFKRILEKAKILSGADRLCIKMYNDRSGKLETINALNCKWQKEHKNVDFKFWEYIEDEVIIKGNPRIITYTEEIRGKCNILPGDDQLMEINQSALIPIKIDNNVFGIIFLDSYRENFFTKDDLLLLNAFSSQAAIALRNARLFNKLEKSTETFPKISELDTDIDKVLKNIAEVATEVLETDILLLYRWDEEHKKIIWPPIYTGEFRELEYIISEEVSFDITTNFIKKGQSYYAENSQEYPIMTSKGKPLKDGIPPHFVFREHIISSAGIILKVGQEIVGVMFINYRIPHKFDEDERRIIENYASYIAIAIQNIKHFIEKQAATRLNILGQLTAVIAHKMKNDIGTISLYTCDLIDETSAENPHYFNLTQIKEKIRKITSDIDNLLVASKKKVPEKVFINLNSLITEIETEIISDLKAKNIELEKKIGDNIPEVKVDPSLIKMVLSNLAYNSIDAMSKGGKITISTSKSMDIVLLDWKDTGKGILPDDGEKIFQPFWTTKNKGFGLGLFLSKSIIEEHGGAISLDLNYREGARFIIEFPIKELI